MKILQNNVWKYSTKGHEQVLGLWKLTSDGKPLVFATSLPPCHLVLVLLIIPKLSPQVFLLWSEVIAWVCKLGHAIHSEPFLRNLILNSTKMF